MKISGSKLVVLSCLVVALCFALTGRVTAQGRDSTNTARIQFVFAPTNVLFANFANQAKTKPDIAKAKSDLVKANVDISGPCGAFKIVQLAVWRATDDSGLLSKPSGNNCQGFATDIVAYPDGTIYDVLVDGGGANTPSWNADAPIDPSRYHAPTDPHFGGSVSKPPVESKSPAITQVDLDKAIAAVNQHSDENTAKIQKQIDQVVNNAEATGSSIWKWLGPLLAGLGGASAAVISK